ncbi:hypothetical protein, partial [Burkholderia sp. Tr-20390]|uniref:hypothetical protein n=1 Tax=Burkholderia sp. Tr-20390 TaxID=2703904 RepID=UPI001F1204A4
LARAFEDRVVQVRAEMQVPLDVLDRHRRIIHQDPDREREPADMPALSDPAQALPPASVDQQAAPAAPVVPAPAVISTSTSS